MSSHHEGDPSVPNPELFRKMAESGEAITPELEITAVQKVMCDQLAAQTAKPGRTNDHPEGMYGPYDEGAVRFAIAADVKNQRVLIDFGTPVVWMAMNPEQAMHIGRKLIKNAKKVLRRTPESESQ